MLGSMKDLIPNEHRGFLAGDLFHYTVKTRPDHRNPPDPCTRETEESERLAVPVKDLQPRREIRG
jgi:hypothetical protein